ncbi:MAG: hypothetical protein HNEKOMLI_00704 [Sodalis sp. Psp]|nr:hypothetical protein [Sodalis sp. Psp]MCR3757319.1 hypothetical protein [Sodalis sp. Ppy]
MFTVYYLLIEFIAINRIIYIFFTVWLIVEKAVLYTESSKVMILNLYNGIRHCKVTVVPQLMILSIQCPVAFYECPAGLYQLVASSIFIVSGFKDERW